MQQATNRPTYLPTKAEQSAAIQQKINRIQARQNDDTQREFGEAKVVQEMGSCSAEEPGGCPKKDEVLVAGASSDLPSFTIPLTCAQRKIARAYKYETEVEQLQQECDAIEEDCLDLNGQWKT